MSLALALRGADGLVLASDSRVTSPEGREDTSEKFLQVNRDTGVMTYGAAPPGYAGISALVQETKSEAEKYSTFDAIAEEAARIFRSEFKQWRKQLDLPEPVPQAAISLGFVLGGYDHVKNIFRVVRYAAEDDFEPVEVRDNPTFAAAQWHVAQFLFDTLYYREMTVEQLVDFAVLVLLETETVEDSVGGPIQLATVTLDKGFQRLHEEDLRPIIRRSQPRISKMRRVLLDSLLTTAQADRTDGPSSLDQE